MTTRSRREAVTFLRSFQLKSVERILPAGTYETISEEELIEGLSFPAYRRVSTFIMVPAAPPYQTSMEMIPLAPSDLAEAQRIDAAAQSNALEPGGDCKK